MPVHLVHLHSLFVVLVACAGLVYVVIVGVLLKFNESDAMPHISHGPIMA